MFEIQVKRKFGDKKIICKKYFFFCSLLKSSYLFIYLFIQQTHAESVKQL